MSNDFVEEQHRRIGNLAEAWQLTAGDLVACAQILAQRRASYVPESVAVGDPIPPEGRVHPVELMLNGMALECLLKALWLKQGNALVRDGRYIGVRGAGDHDLPQLASATGFAMSRNETDLLRRLSQFILYGGRYPVPRDAHAILPTRSPSGGRAPATSWSSPSDQNAFDEIVRRLDDALK